MPFRPSISASRSLAVVACVTLAITITLACLPLTAADAKAADAKDLEALLARPMTPGSVAQLVHHVSQQATQKRLIEAVKHEDPAVRAVAARIAFVTASRGLGSGLIAALA
jgi:hypothetical protein